jgi:hypothetical protein
MALPTAATLGSARKSPHFSLNLSEHPVITSIPSRLGAALLLFAGLGAASAAAQPPATKSDAKSQQGGLPDLVGALKQSPGCLGVETARTSSGKQVIFAWFQDKQAALKWYNSEAHRASMRRFPLGVELSGKPLGDVPDDGGPIMAIASLTMNPKATKDDPHPFKQISIELYRPLGGGLSIGGRFAPEAMKVPTSRKVEK